MIPFPTIQILDEKELVADLGERLPDYRAIPIAWKATATVGKAQLLAAAPLLALQTRVSERLQALRELVPASDAIATLEFIRRELDAAILKARNIETYMSVSRVAELIGRPESTVTRMCRTHGESIGARKVCGAWQIHWPTFDSNMSEQQIEQEKQ